MSDNVISLARRAARQTRDASAIGSLMQSFALHRRDMDDVFWLKENAELLNILECTGAEVSAQDVQCYMGFYATLNDRMSFFPQYYRFLTSIALDLETLGLPGGVAEQLCDFVRKNALAEAELSDLQRAEAVRLLARRGFALKGTDHLIERLHRFINRPATFALPNRKAAYELTHIVFYLSEYGRRDPHLSADAVQSLLFTGILAHLEQNIDLLAEVCVALCYAKQTPPQAWRTAVLAAMRGFDRRAYANEGADDYHEYLVGNWACALSGQGAFAAAYGGQGVALYAGTAPLGTMRALSELLFDWSGPRQARWDAMERAIMSALPAAQTAHLQDVVGATDHFDALFEFFARASRPEDAAPVFVGGAQ